METWHTATSPCSPGTNKLADPWAIKCQPDKHVRIEVKWRDNNCFSTSLEAKDAIDAARENESDQDFVLLLVFHGENDLPIHRTEVWEPQSQEWSKLALFKEPRRYAKFSAHYDHFTLVVMKRTEGKA